MSYYNSVPFPKHMCYPLEAKRVRKCIGKIEDFAPDWEKFVYTKNFSPEKWPEDGELIFTKYKRAPQIFVPVKGAWCFLANERSTQR